MKLLPILLAALVAVEPAAQAVEAELKAAFLLNFVRFVEWPDRAFQGPGAPLVFAIVDADPVADELERLVKGKTVHNRQVVIRRETARGSILGSHMAFWGGQGTNPAGPRNGQGPVLTIGESPQFLARGGAINLFVEDNRIKFEVSAISIDEQGLRVSSRLLALATRVLERP